MVNCFFVVVVVVINGIERTLFEPTNEELNQLKQNNSKADVSQEYPCPMCVRDFKSEWLLQKHLVIVHDQKKQNLKTIECDYCDAILKKETSILYHIKSRHPEAYPEEYKIRMANKESCDLCEIQYPRNPLSLAFHKNTFHPQKDPNNSKNILCRMCGESVRGKNNLRVHIKMVHFNLKPPRCNVCSSYFLV